MMFKIVNHLIDIPASSFLPPAQTVHNTRGHNRRFPQPMARVDSYLHLFFPSFNQNLELFTPARD